MANFVDFTTGQTPRNRWAAALEALSRGLGKIAENRMSSEQKERDATRMDAREAVRQAHDENMARFTQGEESKRATEAQTHEDTREHERTVTASEDRKSARELDEQRLDEEKRYHSGSLSMDAARIGAENKRAETADARAAAAEKRGESNAERDRATAALRSTQADLDATISNKRDIEKQLADPMMKFDKSGQADTLRTQLSDLNTQIGGLQTDLRTLRSSAGYTSSLDKTNGAGGAAKLSPDRQQLYEDLKAKNPDKDPAAILDQVRGVPQKQLDEIMKVRPTAEAGQTPGSADTTGSIAQDSGAGNFMQGESGATATASTAAPAPQPGMPDQSDVLTGDQPAQADQQFGAQNAQAATASTAGAPDAGTELPPDDQQQGTGEDMGTETADNDQKFADMSQQLQQSPEGQGVHATLDRLAQTENPVQSGKLQRQAELQLQSMFPDEDPSGYIDWYTQQQQQEPAFT
jgi:hypothetical protein